MSATYIVIGRYDSERNSYIPGGDIRHLISEHDSLADAARAADAAHADLGGCDGSDALAQVMRLMEAGETADDFDDTYEHDGARYIAVNVFDSHEITAEDGGLGLRVRESD